MSANFANAAEDIDKYVSRKLGIESDKEKYKAIESAYDTGIQLNRANEGQYDDFTDNDVQAIFKRGISSGNVTKKDYNEMVRKHNQRNPNNIWTEL